MVLAGWCLPQTPTLGDFENTCSSLGHLRVVQRAPWGPELDETPAYKPHSSSTFKSRIQLIVSEERNELTSWAPFSQLESPQASGFGTGLTARTQKGRARASPRIPAALRGQNARRVAAAQVLPFTPWRKSRRLSTPHPPKSASAEPGRPQALSAAAARSPPPARVPGSSGSRLRCWGADAAGWPWGPVLGLSCRVGGRGAVATTPGCSQKLLCVLVLQPLWLRRGAGAPGTWGARNPERGGGRQHPRPDPDPRDAAPPSALCPPARCPQRPPSPPRGAPQGPLSPSRRGAQGVGRARVPRFARPHLRMWGSNWRSPGPPSHPWKNPRGVRDWPALTRGGEASQARAALAGRAGKVRAALRRLGLPERPSAAVGLGLGLRLPLPRALPHCSAAPPPAPPRAPTPASAARAADRSSRLPSALRAKKVERRRAKRKRN